MQESRPLVSVIVALYNRRGTLQRCIDSVATQSYGRKELVIIDGGSTDGGIEVLQANRDRISYWESERDRGLYHAFNKGVGKASGDWLYFLGADDFLWAPDVLERMAPHLERAYPPYGIVYGRAAFVSEAGNVLEMLGHPWEAFRRRFRQGFMLPHQAVFHHRQLFEIYGQFNETFRMGGDYEFLLRILKRGDPLFAPDVVVAGYQFGGDSSAPQHAIQVLESVRRAQRLNGVGFPGVLWFGSAARAVTRLLLWRLLGERRARRVLDWGRAVLGKPAFWTRV